MHKIKAAIPSFLGEGGVTAIFSDTSFPVTSNQYPNVSTNYFDCSSNICDSANGRLLFSCNGYIVYDSIGNIIENGDSLQPKEIYHYDCCPAYSLNTQSSIILPKGSNGLYYIFTPTITDTTFTKVFAGQRNNSSYDLMQYHVVDINANSGAGKVIQKNVEMVSNVELSKVGMQAVRHANGYDWWLLKQGADTNIVYIFLVTKDTVVLDTIQGFNTPKFGYFDLQGQSCFSADGSKYAYTQSLSNRIFIADFDRCYGILSNPKTYITPMDSTTELTPVIDDVRAGLCFSENNQFIYLSYWFSIYQFEYNEPDSALAWYRVKHGEDTTLQAFYYYQNLHRGIDGRIYIGSITINWGQKSVINKPNLKGSACEFCRKCLRFNGANNLCSSPANMPDFNLGALPYSCPPLNTGHLAVSDEQLEVYPNPAASILYIKNKKGKKKALYNSVGQLILTTKANEVDIHCLPKGLYYIICDDISQKVMIE